MAGTGWELPADCPSCGQGPDTARLWLGGHAGRAAQHSAGLHLHRPTVAGITNSSTPDGLPVRITATQIISFE